jgi:hypothetical protein
MPPNQVPGGLLTTAHAVVPWASSLNTCFVEGHWMPMEPVPRQPYPPPNCRHLPRTSARSGQGP